MNFSVRSTLEDHVNFPVCSVERERCELPRTYGT